MWSVVSSQANADCPCNEFTCCLSTGKTSSAQKISACLIFQSQNILCIKNIFSAAFHTMWFHWVNLQHLCFQTKLDFLDLNKQVWPIRSLHRSGLSALWNDFSTASEMVPKSNLETRIWVSYFTCSETSGWGSSWLDAVLFFNMHSMHI